MKKKIFLATLIVSISLMVRLFCGVYHHDEFFETHFFIKHRPVWKWSFRSPLGMSDMTMEDLSKQQQIEQQYFNEFVSERGLSR